MATSGSFDFSVDRDDIITEALQICGAIGDGETPTADQLTSCSRTLNMLIKAWQADGLQLFRRKTYTITPTAGTASYSFGSGGDVSEVPTRVLTVFKRDTDNNDTPLTPMSYMEYQDLSSKSQQSQPTSYYFEYLGSTAKLFIWPTYSASPTDTLYVMASRPIYDFDAASDDADVPNYYMLALSWGLAFALTTKYGVDRDTKNEIKEQAMYYKAEALSYDTEQNTSVFVQPARH